MAMVLYSASIRRVVPRLFVKSVNTAKIAGTKAVVSRHLLTAPSGAILPEPKKVPFPFLKLLLVLTPGIYIGAAIAKNGATILEENEIFVPTDDEEED